MYRMSQKRVLEKVFVDFGSQTSMHGVSHVISNKSMKTRVLWSVICMASMGTFLWMFSLLITKFISYPVQVKVHQVRIRSIRHAFYVTSNELELPLNNGFPLRMVFCD